MFVTREHSIEACNVHKNTRTGQGGATGIEPGAGIGAGIGVSPSAAVRVHVPII